jgi:antitoxin component of MazEF toxin-antitoxin module
MASLIKKLSRHGNCFALIIDQPVLALLKIDVDALLELSTADGRSLRISPVPGARVKGKHKREK